MFNSRFSQDETTKTSSKDGKFRAESSERIFTGESIESSTPMRPSRLGY